MRLFSFVCCAAVLLRPISFALAQGPAALITTPNLVGELEHPLRYRPEGGAFVIENGAEFFNRPLYGGNTAFRADAGDKPEFTLYLPGRGGNLRFGLKSAAGTKWLHAAERVVARYLPGEMIYEIRDPLLGIDGKLELTVIALPMTEGLVVRAEATASSDGIELLWAYGGASGQRGKRDGDIGTENVPISEYFQLKPEFCRDNTFELGTGAFTLHSKAATILGLVPAGSKLALGDATQWNSAPALFDAGKKIAPELAVMTGRVPLRAEHVLLFGLQRLPVTSATAGSDLDTYREVTAERPGSKRAPPKLSLLPAFTGDELPRLFAESSAYFAALRTRVAIETPDPFINAAAAALNVAADAVWDESQGGIMHGAIAWRTALLGWRGPYLLDALAWPERARKNFEHWAAKQNTDPIPSKLPPADQKDNLSRSETAVHSNGDISNSHYDMNLVFIDGLFRHLAWTGDLEFARSMWPVIERHLAWERRLFRREFGPEKLPLYEAYAAIWASDDLQYNGGGTAHASAYNYYHNTQAARLAKLVGADATPYEREATLIARAMREYLWLPESAKGAANGHFAEFKDLLGQQLVHPSAALWTTYHTIDSQLTTPEEAWQMTRYVDTQMAHLPVRGPGVPGDANYFVLPSSDWMPYSWSINNVVMGENIHTALAYWEACRPEEAFQLTKSSLLASMFMGICPGNVGSMNYLDVYRRESQRDFADGSGVLSRALIEGLFGVRPDALAGELKIAPGLPAAWNTATLHHPRVNVEFRRTAENETYVIEPHFAKPMTLRVQIPAITETPRVRLNGKVIASERLKSPVGAPRIEIICPASARSEISITWTGELCCPPLDPSEEKRVAKTIVAPAPASVLSVGAHFETVDLTAKFNDRVTQIFQPMKYVSPRSPFASLALPAQGIGAWAGHVNVTAEIDDRGLRAVAAAHDGRLVLPNGVPFSTPGPGTTKNILFTSQWDNYPHEATVPLTGKARGAEFLMAGSTNWMQSRLDNGEVVVAYTDGTTARLALNNPRTWWPIDEDYFIDDYQFRRPQPLPMRVDLKTGVVRVLDLENFKGRGGKIAGGAATVLELPLDATKTLQSLTVRTLANEVVIGLMSVTLVRE